jgi:methyl-accepting chemotaxis protein
MDQVTQQNAALVEAAAAAAESLEEQSQHLQRQVSSFKLKNSTLGMATSTQNRPSNKFSGKPLLTAQLHAPSEEDGDWSAI